MLINWIPKRLNVIPVGKNNHITLLPGINEISDEDWKAMKPLLKLHINAKNIKIVKGSKNSPAKSLIDLSVNKAQRIINQTNDIELLKEWLEIEVAEDKRPEVKRSLVRRIEKVEKEMAPKKPESKPKVDVEDEESDYIDDEEDGNDDEE